MTESVDPVSATPSASETIVVTANPGLRRSERVANRRSPRRPCKELENILTLCSSEGPVAMRNRAMVLLSARLGLRPSEILKLRSQDLDWTADSVLIRAGKTSRERVLPLPEDAGAALARYLHEARPVSAERAVFLRRKSPHLPLRGNGFMAKIVNRLLRQAGI